MSLIDREALYEKACGLEAQALSYIEKIIHDEDKVEEWKIWSAILTERAAFKQDVFDAPEVNSDQKWVPCGERLSDKEVLCCDTRGEMIIGYPYQDEESNTGFSAVFDDVFMIDCAAWMPLPEPYTEDGGEK